LPSLGQTPGATAEIPFRERAGFNATEQKLAARS
jgi:hypothetical protein